MSYNKRKQCQKLIRKIRTTVVSMHTRAFAHLPIVLHCYDVIIFLARKVAQIENNGLGRWLNANPYGQSVIRIFRIVTMYHRICSPSNPHSFSCRHTCLPRQCMNNQHIQIGREHMVSTSVSMLKEKSVLKYKEMRVW